MRWHYIDADYGKPFRRFMQSVLAVFPKNGHWRKVAEISRKVDPKQDLLLALTLLEQNGLITMDDRSVNITKFRLGGTKVTPIGKEEFQVFTGFNRSRKLADSEYGI